MVPLSTQAQVFQIRGCHNCIRTFLIFNFLKCVTGVKGKVGEKEKGKFPRRTSAALTSHSPTDGPARSHVHTEGSLLTQCLGQCRPGSHSPSLSAGVGRRDRVGDWEKRGADMEKEGE